MRIIYKHIYMYRVEICICIIYIHIYMDMDMYMYYIKCMQANSHVYLSVNILRV